MDGLRRKLSPWINARNEELPQKKESHILPISFGPRLFILDDGEGIYSHTHKQTNRPVVQTIVSHSSIISSEGLSINSKRKVIVERQVVISYDLRSLSFKLVAKVNSAFTY